MTAEELSIVVATHTEQIKTLFTNQQRLEKVIDKIDNLTTSINKMAVTQENLVKEQQEVKKDLNVLKEQPGKDAHEIKLRVIIAIITAITSAIIAFILGYFLK